MRLGPVIGGRRYVLTSASVDVVDRSGAFPQVLVPLGRPISGGQPVDTERARFLTNAATSTALVVDQEPCYGMGDGKTVLPTGEGTVPCPDDDLWLVDLAKGKLLLRTISKWGRIEFDKLDEKTGLVKTARGFALRNRRGRTVHELRPGKR